MLNIKNWWSRGTKFHSVGITSPVLLYLNLIRRSISDIVNIVNSEVDSMFENVQDRFLRQLITEAL